MKRILICGSNGLVGQRLALMLGHESDYEVLNTSYHRTFVFDHHLFDYTQLDITIRSDVKSLVSSFRPDIILNAAAMVNVDDCEEHREQAWKINVTGVENLVEISRRIEAKLIHLSTDYVFDGKHAPYSEDDRAHPINYYGRTKLAAENSIISGTIRHTIIRPVLIYGTGINIKKNFATWVIDNLRAGRRIRCAVDQTCNPTYVVDVAQAVISAIQCDAEGVFHISGAESASRFLFAKKAAEIFSLDAELIEPVQLIDLRQKAPRPLVTVFNLEKAASHLEYRPLTIGEGLHALKREVSHITLN